jgi:hypothetical protein
VIEVRNTPTVWAAFAGERLDVDHDGDRSHRRAYDD